MGTLLGDALARAGVVSQKEADRAERELQMRRAAEKARQPAEEKTDGKEPPAKEEEEEQ